MTRLFTKRWALISGVCGAVFALGVPFAYATSVSLTPGTQSGGSPYLAHWSASWTGRAPFVVDMYFGDGTSANTYFGSNTSRNYSHTFTTCTGQTFTQDLEVFDNNNNFGTQTAKTSVGRGNFC